LQNKCGKYNEPNKQRFSFWFIVHGLLIVVALINPCFLFIQM
jgi:hypothetical protein